MTLEKFLDEFADGSSVSTERGSGIFTLGGFLFRRMMAVTSAVAAVAVGSGGVTEAVPVGVTVLPRPGGEFPVGTTTPHSPSGFFGVRSGDAAEVHRATEPEISTVR